MMYAKSSRLLCFAMILGVNTNSYSASWEPSYCLFEYGRILPAQEMVGSLKRFASENGDLWRQIPEDSYQIFNSFDWQKFQAGRTEIDDYCQCAYPHSHEISMKKLQERFITNAQVFNENQEKIKAYESSWIKSFKDKPEAYQVNRETLLWSCDRDFFVPDFNLMELNEAFPDIQEVLLTMVNYIADIYGVEVKGGTFIDRHHDVLETGRKARAKLLDKQTELSVSIEPDTESIAPKFDSSFLPHLEKAQKEGKGIYNYMEFIAGDEELHRYYTKIRVMKGHDGHISGLEVYDPMVMVKLFFPVDKTGKSTRLPEFYQAFAHALMKKHDLSDVRQISKVKYKVLYVSDKKNDQQKKSEL